MSTDWASGPAEPSLTEGEVHVWRADLTTVSDRLLGLLSDDERARSEQILDERTRSLWMRSRCLLRRLLGGYLRADPADLRFAVGANGKPALARPTSLAGQSGGGSFNLSHSDALVLYALTPTLAVGVDVEHRRPVDALALATRLLGRVAVERLSRLEGEERDREFLRLWVRHEAEVKCLGVGIGAAATAGGQGRPWIVDLDVGANAAGALAVEEPVRELRCWDWPPSPGAQ